VDEVTSTPVVLSVTWFSVRWNGLAYVVAIAVGCQSAFKNHEHDGGCVLTRGGMSDAIPAA
jgi:prolipoprotein diacylglyceryltransferase